MGVGLAPMLDLIALLRQNHLKRVMRVLGIAETMKAMRLAGA